MRRLLILFVLFFTQFTISYTQFLSYHSEVKSNSIGIGFLNTYFRFNDSKNEIKENEIITSKKVIPAISYETDDLMITLAYNKFNYDNRNSSYFSVDGYYKLLIPVSQPDLVPIFVPILVRTSYMKISQENQNTTNRFENGDFGIGSGIQFNKSFDWIGFKFIYDYGINYSMMNFSVDYGYSVQNELMVSFDFNQIFDAIGIKIGGRYTDQKWKLSNKKYNYYASGYGAFIGINF
jgi:hypothetical protein